MQITQLDILNIWQRIEQLTRERNEEKRWPLKFSHALFSIKQAIRDQMEFRIGEEQRIFKECGVSFNEDGSVKIQDPAKEEDFNKQMDDLNALVVEIDAEPINISSDVDIDISEQSIEILHPFIHFI